MLRLARNAALLLLRHRTRSLEEPVLGEARRVLQLEYEIKRRFEAVRDRRVATLRTRIHGDLHLGELLFTGKDFVIIDFEGQPQRALSERRIKRSPLRDVASMLRSFHYVSHAALFGEVPGVIKGAEQLPAVEEWARYWNRWVGLVFLREYLAAAGKAPFLPERREDLATLLYTYLLEKALQEVSYEAQNRLNWLRIPLHGIMQLLEAPWPV